MNTLTGIFLLLSVSIGFHEEPLSQSDEKNYYFIEASCTRCDIAEKGKVSNHYVLSKSIRSVVGQIDIEKLASDFKVRLTNEFSHGKSLIKNIVIRKSSSKDDLQRLHDTYRHRYLKKGYSISLITD